MSIRWVTAYLDTREEEAELVETFWARVTGYRVSPRRGPRAEFASLLPGDGDPPSSCRRCGSPRPGGLHLDLHTDDVDHWVTLRDPSGRVYCVTRHPVDRPAD
jgi:hypothetical protein